MLEFLESLIRFKIKIIKNGYTSWSLSKEFSKLNAAHVYFKPLGMSQGTMKGVKIVDIHEDKCIEERLL